MSTRCVPTHSQSTVSNVTSSQYEYCVSSVAVNPKFTLVWTDPPGFLGTGKSHLVFLGCCSAFGPSVSALVNDLDLTVSVQRPSGVVTLPGNNGIE